MRFLGSLAILIFFFSFKGWAQDVPGAGAPPAAAAVPAPGPAPQAAAPAAAPAMGTGDPTEAELLDFDNMDKNRLKVPQAKTADPGAASAAPPAAPAAPAAQNIAPPSHGSQDIPFDTTSTAPAPGAAPQAGAVKDQAQTPPASQPPANPQQPEITSQPVNTDLNPPPPAIVPDTATTSPDQIPLGAAPEPAKGAKAAKTEKAEANPPPPTLEPAPSEEVTAPPPEITDSEQPVAPPPPAEAPQPEAAPAPVASAELSDADAARESRFARIFQKYNSKEISDDDWTKIAGDKSSESYTLQQGDTLWDISGKFFGNGYYWPKVWQLNDSITNPHLVITGNTLQFSPGSSTAAPKLDVKETAGPEQKLSQNDSGTSDDEEPPPEIDTLPTQQVPEGNQIVIPPGRKSKAVLRRIPPSFPDWTSANTDKYDSNGFARDIAKKVKAINIPSALSSIVSEGQWEKVGKVVEMEGGTTVASTFQMVIVRTEEPAKKGDQFTIFSNDGKIYDPISGNFVGYEITTRAEAEIEDVVEGSENTYRAMITFTAAPVRMQDMLRPGKLITRAHFDLQGAPSAVSARIVEGQYNDRRVFNLHEVVYLNRGEEDGLAVGSLLNVLKNVSLRNPDSLLKFDSKPIGIIKVVNVGPHVATAVVVYENDPMMPGDETSLQPANTPLHEVPEGGEGSEETVIQ